MAGRLERMEALLSACMGAKTLAKCPELPFAVSRLAMRFGHTAEPPATLWRLIDSAIFNALYAATDGTMLVRMDDGRARRVSGHLISETADRLLAIAYEQKDCTDELRDALFDLARAGSLCAMRELLSRFALDETERTYLMRVLEENEQAE